MREETGLCRRRREDERLPFAGWERGKGRRCSAALWLLAKREGIGWRLGKEKKYIKGEGAPDCFYF
jgi:hypothetical protein